MAIDAHGHVVAPELVEVAAERTKGLVVPDEAGAGVAFKVGDKELSHRMPPAILDVPGRTQWMDDQGIDIQIVGTWSQLYGYHLDPDDAVAWVELMNDTLISALDGYTDRMKPLVALPLQAPDASAEVIHGARAKGFVGAVIGTGVGPVTFDDPSLDPVWGAAAEVGLPLFMHPEACANDPRLRDYGLVNAVGRGCDTTIACSRMLMSGTLDRFPELKLLVAHGGGTLPYLLGRLQRNHAINPTTTADPTAAYSRLYFDTVVFTPAVLEFLVTVTSVDRVLCGSDNPFPIEDPNPTSVIELSNLGDLAKQAILHDNAVKLFGL